ncbi:hypothetical protein VTK73DRAFT_2393 [Phialemonium thermophilum]|uniref:Rhodopsin domain-containing protein n=1 Tax=Phialemonium thermophilum TaxID=223376 RepID=A0ABR3VS66_9PEZI
MEPSPGCGADGSTTSGDANARPQSPPVMSSSSFSSSSSSGGAHGNGTWKGWPQDFSRFPHPNYGPQINYAIWLLTGLAAGFLALRVYCKFLRHRGLWWDDYVLVVSWVALVAQTALITFNTTIGYGQHIWDFFPRDLSTFLLVSNTSGFFSILAAMWSKTSFALTLLRISEGWTRWLIWAIIASVNLVLGFAALATYIQCTPSEKLWHPTMEGRCWPKEILISYIMFCSAYSGAMDMVLAILPWQIIGKLTMNKKEKIGVLLAMSMGVFAGAVSFAKIGQLPSINKFDLIDGIWLSIFGTAESAVTIMAASIPILRALLRSSSPHPPPASLAEIDPDVGSGVRSRVRISTLAASLRLGFRSRASPIVGLSPMSLTEAPFAAERGWPPILCLRRARAKIDVLGSRTGPYDASLRHAPPVRHPGLGAAAAEWMAPNWRPTFIVHARGDWTIYRRVSRAIIATKADVTGRA